MSRGEVRAFLDRHGLAARRDLGQNFLVDDAVAARLAGLAGVESGEGVIEIGTGQGILTRALAARGARVWTIEIDAGLVRALAEDRVLPDGVTLIHADALELDLASLAREVGPPVRLVANLPYSISAPLLRRLLDLRELLVDWSVMLQRDVALRLLAHRGSRDYGSLAVLHHLTVELDKRMDLSPGGFFPVPNVRSTFVRMRPLSRPPLAPGELERVEAFVRASFSKRRKTLLNALRGSRFDPAEVAAALSLGGHDPGVRAEQLEPEDFLALVRGLAA